MNLDDLGDKLAALNPGDVAEVPYDVYASLFPPGAGRQRARAGTQFRESARLHVRLLAI